MLHFEPLMTVSAEVGEIVSLGPGPLGERRVVQILSGSFEGPQLHGTVLPGADWQILRDDGVLDIDARYVLQEARGGLVRVVSQGYRHGPPEVMARLARGETVEPSAYFFRTVMRFETGAPDLAWLNKTIAVATAERKARRVELKVFKLL
jgi:hypothetical protein